MNPLGSVHAPDMHSWTNATKSSSTFRNFAIRAKLVQAKILKLIWAISIGRSSQADKFDLGIATEYLLLAMYFEQRPCCKQELSGGMVNLWQSIPWLDDQTKDSWSNLGNFLK